MFLDRLHGIRTDRITSQQTALPRFRRKPSIGLGLMVFKGGGNLLLEHLKPLNVVDRIGHQPCIERRLK